MNSRQFSTLYTEHAGKLHFFILGMVKNQAVAEDVTARAWMKAWEHRGQSTGNPKSWVYQIAANEAADTFRREAVRKADPIDAHLEEADPRDFTQELERYLEWKNAAKMATHLRRRLQNALACHLQGMSIAESARSMKVSPSTAGTRIYTAKAKVRALCESR